MRPIRFCVQTDRIRIRARFLVSPSFLLYANCAHGQISLRCEIASDGPRTWMLLSAPVAPFCWRLVISTRARNPVKSYFLLFIRALSLFVPRCPADVNRVRVPASSRRFSSPPFWRDSVGPIDRLLPQRAIPVHFYLNGPLRVPRQWASGAAPCPRHRCRRTFENRISTNELSQALLTLYCYLRRSCGGAGVALGRRRPTGRTGTDGRLPLSPVQDAKIFRPKHKSPSLLVFF